MTILPALAAEKQAKRAGLLLKPITENGIPINWFALTRTDAPAPVGQAVEVLAECLVTA